jgi:GNAT superfamily N-acetyltransferase
MQFELTDALIDDILFSMEDQVGSFLLDTLEGIVVNPEVDSIAEDPENTRYTPLPAWYSSDGYHLMERFAAGFKNPVVREELTVALDRGRGVFRAFKDTLNRYPEAEKRWFSFKEQEMKQEIIRWYNALRDQWGLEQIGSEPEETEDLILEDFIFREPLTKDWIAVEELHRQLLTEYQNPGNQIKSTDTPPALLKEASGLPGEVQLIAETSSGDFAGYIAIARQGKILEISALEVKPEFRGLGIGEELVSRMLDRIDPPTVSAITMDLPVESEGFSQVLFRKSFKPYATRYYCCAGKSAGEDGRTPVIARQR